MFTLGLLLVQFDSALHTMLMIIVGVVSFACSLMGLQIVFARANFP